MGKTRQTNARDDKRIEVAHGRSAVLMRLHGLCDMHLAMTLNDFSTLCFDDGYSHFALDLETCEGMDSTFMGTLLKVSQQAAAQGGWLCLVNVSAENRRLLEMIGLWNLVEVKDQFPIEVVETQTLLPGGDPHKRLAHIREAHRLLVAIDKRNEERFGDFLAALEAELAD